MATTTGHLVWRARARGGCQLWASIKSIRALSGFDLGELLEDDHSLGLGKAGNRGTLGLDAQPRTSLPLCGDSIVGERRLRCARKLYSGLTGARVSEPQRICGATSVSCRDYVVPIGAPYGKLHPELPYASGSKRQAFTTSSGAGNESCTIRTRFTRRNCSRPFRQQRANINHAMCVPAVASDDAVLTIHHDRVRPAEFSDRGGDLRHLGIGVGAGLPGVWDQSRGRTVLHSKARSRIFDAAVLTSDGRNGVIRISRSSATENRFMLAPPASEFLSAQAEWVVNVRLLQDLIVAWPYVIVITAVFCLATIVFELLRWSYWQCLRLAK